MDDFFHVTFFFIWIIQLVPINFEFRKKNKQKTPLKQQQEQHEK